MGTGFGSVVRLRGINPIRGFALFSGRATMMMMRLMDLRMRERMILRRMVHLGPRIWRWMAKYNLQARLHFR
jgi:hypothetical protein